MGVARFGSWAPAIVIQVDGYEKTRQQLAVSPSFGERAVVGESWIKSLFSDLCYQLVFLQCFPGRPSLREVFSKLSVKLIPQPRKTMLRSEYLYHLKDAQVWYELSS